MLLRGSLVGGLILDHCLGDERDEVVGPAVELLCRYLDAAVGTKLGWGRLGRRVHSIR
jgi:hypothetical protein